MRFVRIAIVSALFAAVTVPAALALGFTDSDFPLSNGTVGSAYSFQLSGRGGCPPYAYTLSSGLLPPGVELTPSGLLEGTPTAGGTWGFFVDLADSCGFHSQRPFSLLIFTRLTVAATAAEVGRPFAVTPLATGGKTPYSWSVAGGSLPSGLAFDPASGVISGTPTAAGSFPLKLAAADANDSTGTVDIRLRVAAALTITTARLAPTKLGALYRATIRDHGGVTPIKLKITSGRLPIGLRLNTRTGVLTGTPRTAGTFTITVTATDKLSGTSQQTLTLTVEAKPTKPKPNPS